MKRNIGEQKESHPSIGIRCASCPSLLFQELPKEPSCEAAEGLSAAPRRGYTGSVVFPMVSWPPPAQSRARTQLIQPTYAPL